MTLVLLVDTLRTGSLAVLGTLLQASFEAAVVAAGVFGLCRALPGLPARVRVWMWWLVCAKLLVGLLPVPSLPLAVVPVRAALWSAGPAPTPTHFRRPSAETHTRFQAPSSPPRPPALDPLRVLEPTPMSVPYAALWPMLLLCAWLAVTGVQAARLCHALGRARYLRRHTQPAHAAVVLRLASLVRAFRLAVHPRIFASRLTTVPLLTGIVRPAILLPTATEAGASRDELDLILGHELAHVRRGDLVWGWVPAIAVRLFFFDPLARLAAREYLAAREEACDAEVLQTLDVAPADYGRLLVKLGVATTDDVLAAAGSSPTFAMLKRRLTMLDRSRTPSSRWWWTLAGATAVLLPLTLVAHPVVPTAPAAPVAGLAVPTAIPVTTRPTATRAAAPMATGAATVATVADGMALDQQEVPPPPPAPPPPPPPPAALAPAGVGAPPPPPPVGSAPHAAPPAPPALPWPEVAPAPPAPPRPAVAPAPPAPPTPPARRSRDRESAWILLGPKGDDVMSGSAADRMAARKHQRSSDETLVWFRHKGAEYVSKDPSTIQSIRNAFAPVGAVGDEMEQIGGRMGAQGGRQGALGARQGELGREQAQLASEIARVAVEQARRAAAEATPAGPDRQRAQVERERVRGEQQARQATVEARMKALAEQQRAFGEEMRTLGTGMEQHGAEMRALGARFEEALAMAELAVAGLLHSAVATGAAQPVK